MQMIDESRVRRSLDLGELLGALRAFKRGDFSVRMPLNLTGADGEVALAFNDLIEMNRYLADELARVSVQVGNEGRIGQRLKLPGATGAWAECVDSINTLIEDMVYPVTEVARVIGAVAKGDLSQTMVLDTDGRPMHGEVLRLGTIVNSMVEQLNAFASEVSRVAGEVGTEGKLGGQAQVPGACGLWRDLTDNVNQLAANLTTQVRAIAEVATAVTDGDLTRSIMVEARGEVAALKNNINKMIRNLKDTTRKNNDEDWLKTHLARFTWMLQGHRELEPLARLVLSELAPLVNAQQAVFYITDDPGDGPHLELLASYAHSRANQLPTRLAFSEGLVGQCAVDRQRIVLTDVPPDYVRVTSALGSIAPTNIVILPVLFEGEVKAVIELASLAQFSPIHLVFLDQLTDSIGVVLHTIAANMRTEYLLEQSQSLTLELQSQQQALQKTNVRLERQALSLQESESLLKKKQEELSAANELLQEKARQLALSSRYKSEFLANMSHELRTPLNSVLILAQLLGENSEGNLTDKQIEFADTIRSSGTDLLALINDILDLAKIESGTVTLNIAPQSLADLSDLDRVFRQIAQRKGLQLRVWVDPCLDPVIETDGKRLHQIIKNLLSNAIKFTEKGSVSLEIWPARVGNEAGGVLSGTGSVVAFSVVDTGIGIPVDKQRLIFDAFQQADGTTSRHFGGTGLGLSISRELARLLGGEIHLTSQVGHGSTFTLYLPITHHTRVSARGAAPATHVLEKSQARADVGSWSVGDTDAESIPADVVAGVSGKTVLLVDDDTRNVFALSSALEQYGMRVTHASNGRECIDVLAHTPGIDIVLMDVVMSDLDGYNTTAHIRQLAGYRTMPIIALTAKAMRGDRDKCLDAGATDYIAKPAHLRDLLSMLVRYL